MSRRRRDDAKNKEITTLTIRLAAFAVTLIPLVALAMPWVRVDGVGDPLSGIATITLLASSMRPYLYEVSVLQAVILTIGPILIGLLAVVTGYYYHRRKSVPWAPLVMLAIALAIVFGTTDLVSEIQGGLVIVLAVAVLLTIHQAAIRILVVMRRKRKLPAVYRTLAIATGIGSYRWSET